MSVQKLIKLINLTSSSEDGEALNAIRKANELIKKSGWSWEEIINSFRPNSYERYSNQMYRSTKAEDLFVQNTKGNFYFNRKKTTLFKDKNGLWKFVIDGNFIQKTFPEPSEAFKYYDENFM